MGNAPRAPNATLPLYRTVPDTENLPPVNITLRPAFKTFWPFLQALITQFRHDETTLASLEDAKDWYPEQDMQRDFEPLANAINDYLLNSTGVESKEDGSLCLGEHPLVLKYAWVALAFVSPPLAAALAGSLVVDKHEVTLAFFLHVTLHGAFGKRTALVQGVFGSGKTFSTNMMVFLLAVFARIRTIWCSHNNTPLAEAAANFSSWVGNTHCQPASLLSDLFKRLPAAEQKPKFDNIDVPFKSPQR